MSKMFVKSGLFLSFVFIAMFGAQAADFVVTVGEGETNTYTEAVAAAGGTFENGMRLVKKGLGTLKADPSLKDLMRGIKIEAGVVISTNDSNYTAFGPRGLGENKVEICDGATLRCEGTSYPLLSRHCHLAGSGAAGQQGALVAAGGNVPFSSVGFVLTGDTVACSESASSVTRMFRNGQIEFKGHTLTLRGLSNYGHYITDADAFKVYNTGRLVVDGTKLWIRQNVVLTRGADAVVTLALTNGATFLPGRAEVIALFDAIEATSDSTIQCGSSVTSDVIDATISKWCGAPTIDNSITSLSITDIFKVCVDDLNDGKFLSMDGTISFGADCVLEIVGSPHAIIRDDNDRVTIATSATGITGLPTLAATYANRHWTVAVSADGKSLQLVYDSLMPTGAVDVRAQWGILTGPENAAGNAARFNTVLATNVVENLTLFFPMGDYYFDAALEIGAKSGVTLCGEAYESVLHATGAMTAVLSATGSENLTIRDITFADCAGVAIAASGTTALTVTNCWCDAIGGAISGVTETYPISIANGVDSYVRGNQVLDSAVYTALVYLDGGTTLAGSEPLADGVVMRVMEGETEDFSVVFDRTGRGSIPQDGCVYKVGGGTLIGTNTYYSFIAGLVIEEGTYAVYRDGDLINRNGKNIIEVKDGATILFAGGSGTFVFIAHNLHIKGTGAAGRNGALVVASNAAHDYYSAMSLIATGDATVYCENAGTGLAGIFRFGTINLQGYTVTLKSAASTSGYRIVNKLTGSGQYGRFVLDGCVMEATGENEPANGRYTRNPGSDITFALTNNAVFKPATYHGFIPFGGIEMAEGCSIEGSSAGIDAVIGRWIGAGALNANIATLAITNSITVRAADLKAGHYLTAAGSVTFADTATMTLEDANTLYDQSGAAAQSPFTFVASSTSVTGRPIRDKDCDFAGWNIVSGEDGKSLLLQHSGMLIMLR